MLMCMCMNEYMNLYEKTRGVGHPYSNENENMLHHH